MDKNDEEEMNAGTPPYEESRHFGWADQGDDFDDGYDEPSPWFLVDCEYEDDYRDPMWDEPDDEPEGEHDWQMEAYSKAIADYEHLEDLPRFEKMRRKNEKILKIEPDLEEYKEHYMKMRRPKDRFSSSELRELLVRELKDYDGERGVHIPAKFPDELEELRFSLCILDRVIGNLFVHTDESAPQYPIVHAYSWWTIRVITRNRRRTKEGTDEESQVQALVEFLIKETRWADPGTDRRPHRSSSGFMGLVDEFDDDHEPLSLEEAESDMDEEYPDEDDDTFGHLIEWTEK